jgi:hypothetical protein
MGQQLDLEADLAGAGEAHWSEIVHELFQEISRSSVRRIHHGVAGAGRVLIAMPKTYRKVVLQRLVDHDVFPGAVLRHRDDLEHEDHNDVVAWFRQLVADLVLNDLQSRPREPVATARVLGKVRPALPEGQSLTKVTWTRARDVVLDTIHEAGWTMSERSFVPTN